MRPAHRNPAYRNPFDLWHLLSLDAPTVAALWCWTFGRAAGLRLPWTAPLMLALGTWLLYVGDRLLDGWLVTDPMSLRERHRFHQQHRRAFLAGAAAGLVVLLWMVATRLPARALREDLLLACCAAVYLAIVHLRGPGTRSGALAQWFPKELAVGLVFATATAVPTWARLAPSSPADTHILPMVALFAAVCWINCVAIEAWEAEATEAVAGQPSPTSHSTRWLAQHLAEACYGVALIAWAAVVYHYIIGDPGARPLFVRAAPLVAVSISAAAFAALDRERRRFSPLRLRVAADAALLTPLLFFPVLR